MRYALNLFNNDNWSPFREVDNFFNDLVPSSVPFRKAGEWIAEADVKETETHFLLSVDMPGVAKEDVKIEVIDGQLQVSGERKQEKREEKEGVKSVHSSWGRYTRSFSLVEGLDTEKIEAAYKDGVLRIAVPKAEAPKAKQIVIKDEDKAGFFQRFLGSKKEEKDLN